MTQAALLTQAHAYAARGWAVLPLWWPEHGGCACGRRDCSNAGKHPLAELVPHGLEQATTDASSIASWWGTHPRANLGLRTGAGSGLVVVDVDGADGERSLRSLVERH